MIARVVFTGQHMSGNSNVDNGGAGRRRTRLAEELRANLKRRKAKQRGAERKRDGGNGIRKRADC